MNQIKESELCKMTNTEGLVIQGCGGDLNEWVDGINELLTDEGIFKEGDFFKNISVFEHKGVTNLLFHMDNVKLDVGKLAMWRLKTHQNFGGTWLSDYLANNFDIQTYQEENEKPNCSLIGQDGNIFNLMRIASKTLKDNGLKEQAKEMCERIQKSGSYDEAFNIITDYVNVASEEESQEYDEGFGSIKY